MILIKNIEVYAPEYKGIQDVLIAGENIEWMDSNIEMNSKKCRIIDGTGKILVPGFIDGHVHLIGGGGEGGFRTRAPRVECYELVENGITTVMGLLGTDGITRDVETLLAHAKALNEEGITAYICTGHYGYPSVTLTGDAKKDVVFVQEVLGLKLAISDHRAPNVTLDELIRIGSDMRIAGMIGGKPGCVILHMGDDMRGLQPVFEALDKTSIPVKIFHPTHVNRNLLLLEQGMDFLKMGGYVDYTCGMDDELTPGKCILKAREMGVPTEHITISSDGHGSWSTYDSEGNLAEIGISSLDCLYHEFRDMVLNLGMSLEDALFFFTSNVAKKFDVYPKKGCICEGSDADILIMDKDLNLDTVIAGGKIMMQDGEVIVKGAFNS